MPRFDTPHPITAVVDIGVADIRVSAGERADTVVEVRPRDPGKKADVAAAAQTTVDYTDGRLVVRGPKRGWRQLSFRNGSEAIDVEISLPAGSELRVEGGIADLRCTGPLGECSVKAGVGTVGIDRAGPLRCKTGAGGVTVREAVGHTEVTTGSGEMRIGVLDGTGVLRNANGDIWVGTATGDLRVKAANGRVRVDRAHATATAKTANGGITFGEVGPGTVVAETAMGSVEVGVRPGIAAWLDLDTKFGKVRNELGAAERPAPGEPTVEVRAASAFGDITVRRSTATEIAGARGAETA